jgi:hypothetical protein
MQSGSEPRAEKHTALSNSKKKMRKVEAGFIASVQTADDSLIACAVSVASPDSAADRAGGRNRPIGSDPAAEAKK